MSKPKPKRNKKYGGPKPVLKDPISHSIVGAALFMDWERANLMALPERCFERLRQGIASAKDWNDLSEFLNVAERLCTMQIGSNLRPDIEAGMTAMSKVAVRMMERNDTTPCYAQELAAIREAMDMARVQLRYCTRAEHEKARTYIRNFLAGMPKGDIEQYKARVEEYRKAA